MELSDFWMCLIKYIKLFFLSDLFLLRLTVNNLRSLVKGNYIQSRGFLNSSSKCPYNEA